MPAGYPPPTRVVLAAARKPVRDVVQVQQALMQAADPAQALEAAFNAELADFLTTPEVSLARVLPRVRPQRRRRLVSARLALFE